MSGSEIDNLIQKHLESVEDSQAVKGAEMLLDPEKIDMISDIPEPLGLSILELFADHLKTKFSELDECTSAKTIKSFVAWIKKNRISHKRKSREEVLKALTGISGSEEAKSLGKALLEKRGEEGGENGD